MGRTRVKPICPDCNLPSATYARKVYGVYRSEVYLCPSCHKKLGIPGESRFESYSMDINNFLNSHSQKYQLILADPPWPVKNTHSNSPGADYPKMPYEEILNLPIKGLAEKNSVLFLWVVKQYEDKAWEIMEHWGFTKRDHLVWVKATVDKLQLGMGMMIRNADEWLDIGKRGKGLKEATHNTPSVILARRTGNSQKPAKSYYILEKMFPEATRIELFARRRRRGWVTVGNQLEKPSMESSRSSFDSETEGGSITYPYPTDRWVSDSDIFGT